MADDKKKNLEDKIEDLKSKYKLQDIDVFTAERDKAEEEIRATENTIQEQYRKTKGEAIYNRDMAMKFLEERSRSSRFLNLGRELASIQNAYLSATADAESKYNLGMLEIQKQRKKVSEKFDFQDIMWKFNHGQFGGKTKRDFVIENKSKFGGNFAEMLSRVHNQAMSEFSSTMQDKIDKINTKDDWVNEINEMQKNGMNLDDNTIQRLKKSYEVWRKSDFKRGVIGDKNKIANLDIFNEDSAFYKNSNGDWVGEVKGGKITDGGATKKLFAELTETRKQAGILNEQVFGHGGAMYVTKDDGITFERLEIAKKYDGITYDKKNKDGKTIKGSVQNNDINTYDKATDGLFTIHGETYRVNDKAFSNVKSGAVLGSKLFGVGKRNGPYKAIYSGFMNVADNRARMIHLLKQEKNSGNHTVGAKDKFDRAINEINNGKITEFALAQYIRASRSSNKGNKNTVTQDNSIVGYAHGKYWTILDGKLYELKKG